MASRELPPVRRTGLHPLECPDCADAGVSVTFQQLERRARAGRLPRCCDCGLELVPVRLELVLELVDVLPAGVLERCSAYADLERELASLEQGKGAAYQGSRPALEGEPVRDRSGGKLRPAREGERVTRRGIVLRPAATDAMVRVLSAQARELERRRAAGLVQVQRERAAAEDLPF